MDNEFVQGKEKRIKIRNINWCYGDGYREKDIIETLLHVLDPPLLLLEGTQESALTNVNGRTSHVAPTFADQTCHVFTPPT